jgi:hypothetical protein
MHASNKHIPWFLLDATAVLAGIIYDSWPLGYVLNPAVARGLASDLEGLHQPYNWVFIGGDITSSLMMVAICVYLCFRLRKIERWLGLIFINMGVFAFGTILDAGLPLRCESAVQQCPNFIHDPLLFVHGIFSILGSVGLFFVIFFIWRRLPKNWIVRSLLIGYGLFALFSLIDAIDDSKSAASQHYYITLCSLCLAFTPWAIRRGLAVQSAVTKKVVTS